MNMMMEKTKYHSHVPTIGDRFPDIVAQTTQGEIRFPEDFHGSWFILFSHPGDFTPVCTTEFVAFEQLLPKFLQHNCKLIGLSVESAVSHLKWIEWIYKNLGVNITFPIIADPLGKIAQKLGMIHPETGTATVRKVFIVDPKGSIRLTITYPEQIGRNIYELLRALEALQVSVDKNVVIPANWPNNEILGDHVLLPPPRSTEQLVKRTQMAQQGEVKCYDWWFCSKDVGITSTTIE